MLGLGDLKVLNVYAACYRFTNIHHRYTISRLTGHRSRQSLLHPTLERPDMRCAKFQIKR